MDTGDSGRERSLPNRDLTGIVTAGAPVTIVVRARDYSHPSIIGWCPLNETQGLITDQIDLLSFASRVKNIEEFYQQFAGLCAVPLKDQNMFGYCYTQLTDVFQEQNGIYHFDRTPKFDMDRIRAAQCY